MKSDEVRGMLDARCGPVTRDHGEHPVVVWQHVHGQRGYAPRPGAGDQRAHQRRAHAQALPGVGHHHADIGRPGVPRAGLVCRHGVADDHAAPDRDYGVSAAVAAGHPAEQLWPRRDRCAESQVSGLQGQS